MMICYNMRLIEEQIKQRPDRLDYCVWKYVWDLNVEGKGTSFKKDDPRIPCRECSGLDERMECYISQKG